MLQQNKNTEFISKAIKIHGNRYDYSKVEYINARTKITIVCKEHGEFYQRPDNHLSNYNCQKCSKNFKLYTTSFIERAKEIHGDKYDYSQVNYINANIPVTIICREHGEFNQIPDFHINRKCNCPKCHISYKSDTTNFIKKANKLHKNKYDYSKVDYINNYTHVIIICPKHGEFKQTPDIHFCHKCGCPSCINKTEFKFYEKMKILYPSIQRQFKADWCKNKQHLPFDIVIEEQKIIIEVDGQQHFEQIANWTSPEIQQEKDKFKMECANQNGFSVIRLLQKDVSKDTFDWLSEIVVSIQKIIADNVVQKCQTILMKLKHNVCLFLLNLLLTLVIHMEIIILEILCMM
jgi:very-short-patch-repair endonuclease